MAQKFKLNLLREDWETLDKIAKQKGFQNFRSMIPSLLEDLPKKISIPDDVECNQRRFQNNFPIPTHLQDFYINLGCKKASSISSSIFRALILPLIIDFENQEAGNGS